jgi:hypothetical protein
MTSLIRHPLPVSIPFIRLISTASGGSSGAQLDRVRRSDCAGTAIRTRSAPRSASAGSLVTCN